MRGNTVGLASLASGAVNSFGLMPQADNPAMVMINNKILMERIPPFTLCAKAGRVMRIVLSLILLLFFTMNGAQAMDYPWRGFDKKAKPVDVTTISIENPEGRMVGMGAWRGSWVLLNTWAAWCAPCVAELPTLEKLSKTHGIENFTVIAVSQDAGKKHADVLEFLGRYNIGSFAAYSDPALLLEKKLKSAGLPMTYLINPEGRVVAEYRGAAAWDSPQVLLDLKQAIKRGKI